LQMFSHRRLCYAVIWLIAQPPELIIKL
jgi:hypothetical protein